MPFFSHLIRTGVHLLSRQMHNPRHRCYLVARESQNCSRKRSFLKVRGLCLTLALGDNCRWMKNMSCLLHLPKVTRKLVPSQVIAREALTRGKRTYWFERFRVWHTFIDKPYSPEYTSSTAKFFIVKKFDIKK